MIAECIADAKAELGESPVWSAEENALYWVDILAPALHRLDVSGGAMETWHMPQPIGCLALRESGGVVVGLRDGFYFFDLQTGKLDCITRINGQLPGTRLNDGKVSPDGRFWAGTMDDEQLSRPIGSLYCLDAGGELHEMAKGFIVSNGLAWDASGSRMFFADTRADSIWTYDYDMASGSITNRSIFARPTIDIGRPDGGAADVEGCYWSAGVSADVLNCWDGEGNLLTRISLPCARPTMPCFGGHDMKTIFVTSSRHGATGRALKEKPQTGGIFALRVDTPGVPISKFKG